MKKEERIKMLKEKLIEMQKFETALRQQGVKYIAGVDEVGRGPLAGPVVAAAVVLPEDFDVLGVDDSKKLSEKKREELFGEIMEKALAVGLGMRDNERIDEINILEATKEAMAEAVFEAERNLRERLENRILPEHQHTCKAPAEYQHTCKAPAEYQHTCKAPAEYLHTCKAPAEHQHTCKAPAEYQHTCKAPAEIQHILFDAMVIDAIKKPQTSLIKGDGRSLSIAAASIIAKVTRDNLMKEYAKLYPHYGFESNKGYGTKAHYQGIAIAGITPIHRKTFVHSSHR